MSGDSSQKDDLDNDEQGTVGEAKFSLICANAKLVANKTSNDRAGYDFAVNARVNRSQSSGLDSRPAPLSCRVQVKTIKVTRDRIKLRLSSIEQLAKDLGPTFIYVFRIHPSGRFGKSYLIHLIDENLATVLAKLRSEEAAGRPSVNNAELYMIPSKVGVEISPTGPALRSKLEELCGSDPAAYVAKKSDQLRKLGYKGTPFSLSMNLKLNDVEEFTDVMLGLRTKIPAKIVDQRETRFGIEIQQSNLPAEGEITVSPAPRSTCKIIIKKDRFASPVTLDGHLYEAPTVADLKKLGAIAARCDLLDIVCKMSPEKLSVKFRMKPLEEGVKFTATEWLNYFKIAQAASTDGFSIEIRTERRPPLRFADLSAMVKLDNHVVDFDATIAAKFKEIMQMASAPEDTRISYEELLKQANLITSAHCIIINDPEMTPLTFDVELDEDVDLSGVRKGIHINFMSIGSEMLVWSADVDLEMRRKGRSAKFISTSVKLREILPMEVEAYTQYVAELGKADPSAALMARSIGEEA
ncbi:hypothetical protein [Methylobacterium sp. Leaf456]|uniref:hypothetical protein n=1 Tax=Methylobacterium sp. Leaf456 TaxID=1736382 RepID=UPI000A9DE490|nr:hypothetical protein [Methylobacterium sp. Leaf456]